MKPVDFAERNVALDALRGMALLGVLMVNLLVGFRVSLFQSILTFHTHAGWPNHTVDVLAAWVLEFKAFTLFSFLFGVGVGVQMQRVRTRKANASSFFVRRFTSLLVIGLCHMLLIWNGDILTLYAVCGLLLIPFVALSAQWLAVLGIVIIGLSPYLPFFGALFPTEAATRAQAELATHVYAAGSVAEIMALRWHEAGQFIAPLLIGSLPRTFGLMLLGIAAWRSDFLQWPTKHHKMLKIIAIVAGSLGALTTTLQVWAKETGSLAPAAFNLFYPYSAVLLALAYGVSLLFWFSSARHNHWLIRMLAAAGRISLSNYLVQSVIFSLMFYGFGFGMLGKLGSAVAALFGLAVFIIQLVVGNWWLERFRFGPAEWLWRLLSYGHWRQKLRKG